MKHFLCLELMQGHLRVVCNLLEMILNWWVITQNGPEVFSYRVPDSRGKNNAKWK